MLIVKKLRLQRGWSQADLAEFSGLSVRTIQRIEKGETPGLESQKTLAAVFDLEVSDFQEENSVESNFNITSEEEWAMRHVQNLKGFYSHLITYTVVMLLLFVLDYVTSPDDIWVVWPVIGWGIGVSVHGIKVFGRFRLFGPQWEKRQVEKLLGRKL